MSPWRSPQRARTCLNGWSLPVLDIVYFVAIIAVAAVVLLVAKGVEKL